MKQSEYKTKVENVLQSKSIKFVEGSMDNIAGVDFPGVYAIFDNDNLIYIGSAYAADRTIEIRLKQYLSKSNTGNTLIKAMRRSGKYETNQCEDQKITDKEIEKIKSFKYVAFEHKSLEYDLIEGVDGLLNKAGNK